MWGVKENVIVVEISEEKFKKDIQESIEVLSKFCDGGKNVPNKVR